MTTETEKKVVPEPVKKIAEEMRKRYAPCETCKGEGTAPIPQSYLGDHMGQHDVCAACVGTGWSGGKLWVEKVKTDTRVLADKERELRMHEAKLTEREKALEFEVKRGKQALLMLEGLAAREAALDSGRQQLAAREEKLRLERIAFDEEVKATRAVLDVEHEQHEENVERRTMLLDEREKTIRECKSRIVEELRESIRKPFQNLADEMAALRRKL